MAFSLVKPVSQRISFLLAVLGNSNITGIEHDMCVRNVNTTLTFARPSGCKFGAVVKFIRNLETFSNTDIGLSVVKVMVIALSICENPEALLIYGT